MVKYYGRARQRTGSVNRNQPGLKQQGVMGSAGKPRFLTHHINTRVNANAKTGCVENGKLTGKLLIFSNGQQTCVDNERYQLIPQAPRSRGCAGGVGQIFHTRCNIMSNTSTLNKSETDTETDIEIEGETGFTPQSSMISSPANLKTFYNIPDIIPGKPISIGLFQSLGQYISRNDLYLYVKNQLEQKWNLNHDESIKAFNNMFYFINGEGEDDLTNKAHEVWTGNTGAGAEASLDAQIAIVTILGNLLQINSSTNDLFLDKPLYRIFIFNTKKHITSFFQYLDQNHNKSVNVKKFKIEDGEEKIIPVNTNLPNIWSISYGAPEYELSSEELITFTHLAKEKYQIFMASGDSGSSNCRGGYNGDIIPGRNMSPYITVVGATHIIKGTEWNTRPIEIPSVNMDNPNCSKKYSALITSGGGMDELYLIKQEKVVMNTSQFEAAEFQKSFIDTYIQYLKNKGNANTHSNLIDTLKNSGLYPRAYPDVALSGNKFYIYQNGVEYVSAGTSASCPLMASIYAIMLANTGKINSIGRFNEFLYNSWNPEENTFLPVISPCEDLDSNKNTENSSMCGNIVIKYGWSVAESRLSTNKEATGVGYDCVVGLGSINFTKLQEKMKNYHFS